MSNERDFDRLAKAWLELGANEAPDRVVAAILEATEDVQQVRRRFGWPSRVALGAPRLPIAAAVAVALSLLAGGVILLTRGDNLQVAAPSAAPSATPVPSPSLPAAFVPAALRMVQPDGSFPDIAVWVGGPRSLPGQDAPASGTALRVTDTTLALSQSNQVDNTLLLTSATGTEDGDLQLTLSAGCADAVGDYQWALSADGRRLTITAISDPCALRMDAVSGEWLKVACRDPQQPCLGDFAAGSYSSLNFAPRLVTPDSWTPEYGAVTYTVPVGWANAGDWPGQLVLVPSADYATYGPSGTTDGSAHEVVVVSGPAMSDQTADCKRQPETSVDRSVGGFIDWLRAQPRIVTSEPRTITVGGYPGQWIDVTVAPTWTTTCPGTLGGSPTAIILTQVFDAFHETTGTLTPADASWGLVGDERMRLVFVDIGQGDVVLIWVDATDPTRFQALATEAMPIIESMTIK